jgi:hypothetical protein
MEALKHKIREILTEGKYLTANEIVELEHQVNQISKLMDPSNAQPKAYVSVDVPGVPKMMIEPIPHTEFIKHVETMREAQKAYFRTRDNHHLGIAKALEAKVDRMITEYKSQIKEA